MTWENRITFEVSSADPDSDSPVWVDFTARVRDVVQVIEVNTGRQNDLEGVEPTAFTLVLDNSDDALTYGNTASPYASWWGPGRKCRLRDTIGANVFDIATGYLQTPTEGLVTVGIEHRIELSIVDRLARLGSAAPLIGTLAEHIIYAGGSELKGYWTCCDETGPFRDLQGIQVPLAVQLNYPTQWATASIKPTYAYQSGTTAPGDDLLPITFTSAPELRFFGWELVPQNIWVGSIASGEFLTFVFWLNLDTPPTALNDEILLMALSNGADLNLVHLQRLSPDGFSLSIFNGSMSANITTAAAPWGTPIPIGIQIGINPNSMKLWVGDVEYTTTPTGSPASPQSISSLQPFIGPFSGSIGHFQLYTGIGYNRTKFLAQRGMGNLGMERQTTGERIRTIATYAGVRGGEMNIDTGTSVMQKATLAGQTPLEAMRDAERTEQGLLYVDGSGILQFRDRRSLYNI